MPPLTIIPLPLPNTPPPGYAWSERALSQLSTTTGFETGLNERDILFGQPCCVICGKGDWVILEHCHIIPKSESHTWSDLKDRGWLPQLAKDNPHHEPRNGLMLCKNHHAYFDAYQFFIRFFPEVKKFVMINYSNLPSDDLRPYHGKAIALDVVESMHPSLPFFPDMPDNNTINWQEWIKTSGVWDNTGGHFRRHGSRGSGTPGQPQSLVMTPMTTHEGGGPSAGGTQHLDLNDKAIGDILAATRAMPSWKECDIEGTRWTGTAEENRLKYLFISQV